MILVAAPANDTNFDLLDPFIVIFSKTLFLLFNWVSFGLQNKVGHHARPHNWLMQVPTEF